MAYRKTAKKKGWTVRRQVQRDFASKADALRFDALVESAIAEAWRKYGDGTAPCVTIRDGLQDFLANSAAGIGRRPAGCKTLERHKRRLLDFARAFQGKRLDAITVKQVERWIGRRLAAGVSPDTVNADLISLRAFARWAQKKGRAPAILPLLTVERLQARGKLPGKNRKPPRAREMGEIVRILQKIRRTRPDMGLFLSGMALFGLRPANVWELRREDVRMPRAGEMGRLHVKGLKGTPDREIAVPPGSLRAAWARDCLALGRRCGRDRLRAPLVPNLANKSRRNPGGWTTGAFDMALRRLVGGMKIRLTPYEIRHSCMTFLLRHADIAPANSQGFAGHTRIETQNAYNHLLGEEAEPAYRIMEEALKGAVCG